MFCQHKQVPRSGGVCPTCFQRFGGLAEVIDDLRRQVGAFQKALRLLPLEEPVAVEFRDGLLWLNGRPVTERQPEPSMAAEVLNWQADLEFSVAKELA